MNEIPETKKPIWTPLSEIKVGQHVSWWGQWAEVRKVEPPKITVFDEITHKEQAFRYTVSDELLVRENQP